MIKFWFFLVIILWGDGREPTELASVFGTQQACDEGRLYEGLKIIEGKYDEAIHVRIEPCELYEGNPDDSPTLKGEHDGTNRGL